MFFNKCFLAFGNQIVMKSLFEIEEKVAKKEAVSCAKKGIWSKKEVMRPLFHRVDSEI